VSPLAPVAIVSLLLGILAVWAALRVRKTLAAGLGRDWLIRFWVVTAGPINVVLLAVVLAIANNHGWTTGVGAFVLPLLYGVLFFFFSLSNIDWTAKKFHPEESE
jgi:hypothetical protein